jgi:hypothetical protein
MKPVVKRKRTAKSSLNDDGDTTFDISQEMSRNPTSAQDYIITEIGKPSANTWFANQMIQKQNQICVCCLVLLS